MPEPPPLRQTQTDIPGPCLPQAGRTGHRKKTRRTNTMIAGIWFSLGITAATLLVIAILGYLFLGVRYIPHRRVGIIEKLWSASGSLTEGRIIALNGEAGFQAKVLRGGLYFGYPFWKFTIHKVPLVTVAEGRIGYVYARDGQPLPPVQTLGRIVNSNGFQDAVAFLENGGQRGRQRG